MAVVDDYTDKLIAAPSLLLSMNYLGYTWLCEENACV